MATGNLSSNFFLVAISPLSCSSSFPFFPPLASSLAFLNGPLSSTASLFAGADASGSFLRLSTYDLISSTSVESVFHGDPSLYGFPEA